MPSDKPIFCWDAVVIIAWLKDEKRANGDMAGVYEVAERVNRNEAILLTSQYVLTEILPGKCPPGAMEKLEQFFKRRNAIMKPADMRIMKVAQEIRNVYPKMSSADSIYIATAIHYQATQFHTFDNGGHDGFSLLALNGNVAGYPLTICKPPFKQYRLPGM